MLTKVILAPFLFLSLRPIYTLPVPPLFLLPSLSLPPPSEGDGVSFQTRPMRADCELATMGSKHAHLPLSANGHTSGEESEVEILAAEDLEKQPLTKMSQL